MDSETRLEMLLTPWVQSWFQYPQQKMQMGNGVVTPSQSMTHKSQPVAQKQLFLVPRWEISPRVSVTKSGPATSFHSTPSMAAVIRPFTQAKGILLKFRVTESVPGSGSNVESRHLDVGVDSSRRKSRQIVCPPRTPHTHVMGARSHTLRGARHTHAMGSTPSHTRWGARPHTRNGKTGGQGLRRTHEAGHALPVYRPGPSRHQQAGQGWLSRLGKVKTGSVLQGHQHGLPSLV